MSRQLSMDSFFKGSCSSRQIKKGDINEKKRRNLHLIKKVTPIKTRKIQGEANACVETLNLCSDEEDQNDLSLSNENTILSDLSQSTISYEMTPRTPQRTPQSAKSSSNRTPRSGEKFYSPTKKKAIKKLTPVKKSLLEVFRTCSSNTLKDEVFEQACQGMDDKTIFLLTTINKCMHEESLKRLLDVESQELLAQCLYIVKPGMKAVCRLFWRQHVWYRLDKLRAIASEKSMGDNDCQLMITSLLQCGLIVATELEGEYSLTFDDCISLLKTDELKSLCKDLKIKMTSKQQAKEALQKLARTKTMSAFLTGSSGTDNSRRIMQMLKQKTGCCYKLSELACSSFKKLYMLMYLGINYNIIREKKLELTLLYDKIKRETYPVDKEIEIDNASIVFGNSFEFLMYFAANDIYEEFIADVHWEKKCDVVEKAFKLYKDIENEEMMRCAALPPWLRRFTPANVYVKILEAGVQELKKYKDPKYYALAVDILTALISQNSFRQHKKAEWYDEKALILHKLLHREDEAAEVLIAGFECAMSDEAKDLLRPRALRLARRRPPALRAALARHARGDTALEASLPGYHLTKTPMDNYQRGKIKFQTWTQNGQLIESAEECCITHYLTTGKFTHGEHWEGRIVCTMFFLLFWDIIYSKPRGVTGVFLNHYQMYPLDMFSESFYTNRKTQIEDQLALIRKSTTDELLAMLTDKWEERPEHEMSGIVRSVPVQDVCAVVLALGPPRTAALCHRLALDYGYAHSGFPDLTLWDVRTNKVKFVEVKTDADKPSMKQIQWMHYLMENGIDTGFCYVGVNTTRCKARARERGSSSD